MKKSIGRVAYHIYFILTKVKRTLNNYYYKTIFNGFDKNMHIFGYIRCVSPQKVTFGDNCTLNEGVFLHGEGEIEIGNNVTISAGAKLISYQYNLRKWKESCNCEQAVKDHEKRKIYIGDHAWICAGVIILPGVRITGRGVVVGAGTVLNKDIDEDYVLVAGNPGKIIKRYNYKG